MSLRASSLAKAVRSSTEAILSFVEWKTFLTHFDFFNFCQCLPLFVTFSFEWKAASNDAEQTIVHAAGRLRSEESNMVSDLSQSHNSLNRDLIYQNLFLQRQFKTFIQSSNKHILDKLVN